MNTEETIMVHRCDCFRRTIAGCVALCCTAVLLLATGCEQQYGLVLNIGATTRVSSFDLLVKDLEGNKIVLNRKGEAVDAANPDRDISQGGQRLQVVLECDGPGTFLVYLRGLDGAAGKQVQFYINAFEVDSVVDVDVMLIPLSGDADGDGFPACGAAGISCTDISCAHLDCDDNAATVHPFAAEVCGNGKDDDCSEGCNAAKGAGDTDCVDADGDGVAAGQDCDDNDPCRSPRILEARNICDKQSGKCKTLELSAFALPAACKKKMTPPYCGDGIDQDCDGKDVTCFTDDDCDDYAPPQDCNDKECKINPGADEDCNNKIDDNCNKVINEGCSACDVDGDNFAAPGSSGAACNLPATDPDDYDSGVHPDITKATNASEGGTALGALREFCSHKLGKDAKKHRDVDHDGDKLPASLDGCPSSNCDADGDGFMNNSTGCNPPISKRDCNDNDAQAFPGAPDKCGDGKAQNCHSDSKCADVTDKDGDGYSPPADCDDSDKQVHPWATETCDGVDNDCDGLVDEGNPDATGKPIDTRRMQCTDDNDGQCFPPCKAGDKDCVDGVTYKKPGATSGTKYRLSGVCACSRQKPNGVQETGNRVVCAGEDLSGKASLRCFGAIPSSVRERCDTLDHDCNGKADAPVAGSKDAQNLLDYGKSCGVNQGSCTTGTVTGCDLYKTVANASLVQKVIPAFNVNWICKGAQLPLPESCNGKDDDCDKVVPASEGDNDKDGYIACSVAQGDDCKKGSSRLDLSSKYQGCGDCDDKLKTVYPKATETCNGVDDNCSKYDSGGKDPTGLMDDGVNECPPQGMVCCSTMKACQNLKTSFNNCNGCGKTCNYKTADQCVGGICKCSGAAACSGGRNCKDKTCKCITGKDSLCTGCCDGAACLPHSSQSPTKCGTQETCKSCDDGNDCTEDKCAGKGVCSNLPRPYLYGCKLKGVAGKCIGTSCCTGCISGGKCQGGTHVDKCGKGGETCKICYTSNICKERSCTKGICEYPNSPTTKKCPDTLYCTVNEHCSGGACVTSQRSCPGDQCNNGACKNIAGCYKTPVANNTNCNDSDKCTVNDKCQGGKCGGDAKNCSSLNDACNTGKCNASSGSCYKKPHTGTPFIANCDNQWCTTNDTCLNGTCKPGATRSCSSSSTQCRTGYCNFTKGACDATNKSNGTSCTATGGKSGKCQSGVCVALPPDQGVSGD